MLSRRTILRAGVAGGVTAGLVATSALDAGAVAAPRIYTRAEWGARPPTRPITVLQYPPDHLIVHHTASPNTTNYSLAQAFAVSHWAQDLHMDQNGWIDAGQQLTISRGGYVMEGRDRSLYAINRNWLAYGTQVANHNNHTLGIENEGLYTSVNPTTMLMDSLVQTLAWLCQQHGLDPYASIVGHRDYNTTQCPGDVLYARLPEIRNRVDALLG